MSAAEQSIADVLDRAADLIEPEGAWMQTDYSNALGIDVASLKEASCWCVAGAIGAVANMPADMAEEWASENFLPLIGVEHIGGAPGWNDDYDRTQVEVVAALREAASLAREQGK